MSTPRHLVARDIATLTALTGVLVSKIKPDTDDC
jgi:hypothetical protein